MLARKVVESFDGRAEFVINNFGDSDLGQDLGVKAYPAIFIDDVLVATPNDFWDWGKLGRGRYTPWRETKNRDAFVQDMTELLSRRLATGSLDQRIAADSAGPAAAVTLPALKLTDLGNQAIDMAAWKGRAVVVAFWAPWCPPCQHTLPWLLDLSTAQGDNVEVLALALQTDEEAVRKAVGSRAAKGSGATRVALGSTDDAEAFGGVMAVPTLMVFSPEGSLAAVFHGAPPDLTKKVEKILGELGAES